jgi:Na+-translocating ferredoxin:NAD+ oxidoreductase RnfG subunit
MTTFGSRVAAVARKPLVPWVLFFVALFAAIVFGILLKVNADAEAREEQAQDEVRESATEFVLKLTNITHETIDQEVPELEELATGTLLDEINELFSEENTQAIKDAEVALSGEIDDVFIQSLGDETATVFVVATVEVSNDSSEAPVPGIARMEMGLDETDQGWKPDRLELFQSPDEAGIFPGS